MGIILQPFSDAIKSNRSGNHSSNDDQQFEQDSQQGIEIISDHFMIIKYI